MRIASHKKLYLPAFFILSVVLILLIFISLSTYRNLHRQQQNSQNQILLRGLALLQALEAGAHSGILTHRWDAAALDHLILELGRIQDVAYLYVLDAKGAVAHHSSPQRLDAGSVWTGGHAPDTRIQTRLIKDPDGVEIFEIAKRYVALNAEEADPERSRPNHAGASAEPQPVGSTVLLGLKMTAFDEARRADIHHAVIMTVIVLALGAGAVYFIYVIQKYYLTNRTLQQTQEYARQVVASIASALFSIDMDGRVVTCNLPALKLLEISTDVLPGLNLGSLLDFDRTGISDTLVACRPNLDREILFKGKRKMPMPLSVSVTPMTNHDGTCRGAVILMRDLSHIKALEAKMRHAEKLAAIGALAAGVAHEIRNPLSSIKGFARFLQRGMAEGAKEREYAQVIIREVDRINAVVNDLLTLARPMTAKRSIINTAELIHHAIRLVQLDANANQIDILTRIDADVEPICADFNQLTQALLNLLLNAMHAIGRAGDITVGVENARDHQTCLIWVQDNGPGVADKLREQIFDPFFTTREKGTGLGLAIVRRIIEAHHGHVDVASPPPGCDRGSRFTMRVPISMDRCAGGRAREGHTA